jgi:enterochelin esterase family protein
MHDIIPAVEADFRVNASPDNRAIAGLSMGGGHTTQVFGQNPDQFAYVSIWSAGTSSAEEYESTYADFLAQADEINNDVEFFSIVVGTDDFAHSGSTTLSQTLSKHGIEHEFIETGGGHTWINWRQYLNEFAQVIFH